MLALIHDATEEVFATTASRTEFRVGCLLQTPLSCKHILTYVPDQRHHHHAKHTTGHKVLSELQPKQIEFCLFATDEIVELGTGMFREDCGHYLVKRRLSPVISLICIIVNFLGLLS